MQQVSQNKKSKGSPLSVRLHAVGNDSGIAAHNAAGIAKQVMQMLNCLPLNVRLCAVGNDSGIAAHNAAGVAKQVLLTSQCKALCSRQRFWDCCS
jgi:hypothetical protein